MEPVEHIGVTLLPCGNYMSNGVMILGRCHQEADWCQDPGDSSTYIYMGYGYFNWSLYATQLLSTQSFVELGRYGWDGMLGDMAGGVGSCELLYDMSQTCWIT